MASADTSPLCTRDMETRVRSTHSMFEGSGALKRDAFDFFREIGLIGLKHEASFRSDSFSQSRKAVRVLWIILRHAEASDMSMSRRGRLTGVGGGLRSDELCSRRQTASNL